MRPLGLESWGVGMNIIPQFPPPPPVQKWNSMWPISPIKWLALLADPKYVSSAAVNCDDSVLPLPRVCTFQHIIAIIMLRLSCTILTIPYDYRQHFLKLKRCLLSIVHLSNAVRREIVELRGKLVLWTRFPTTAPTHFPAATCFSLKCRASRSAFHRAVRGEKRFVLHQRGFLSQFIRISLWSVRGSHR